MIKRPALRVPCIADVASGVLDELEVDFTVFGALLPFPVLDFEITGSAARGDWQLHSDLDINIVAACGRDEARRLWRANKDQTCRALAFLRTLMDKWGLRIEVSLEAEAVKDIPSKSCYRLRERRHYRPENTTRVDIDPQTGEVRPRQVTRLRPPRFNFSYVDEDGVQHINEDPYSARDVERWARVYGDRFQRIGETPDTAHLKR